MERFKINCLLILFQGCLITSAIAQQNFVVYNVKCNNRILLSNGIIKDTCLKIVYFENHLDSHVKIDSAQVRYNGLNMTVMSYDVIGKVRVEFRRIKRSRGNFIVYVHSESALTVFKVLTKDKNNCKQ